MWEKIKKYLFYSGLDRDQFVKVSSLVAAENAVAMKLAAVVQILYFGISFIGSLGLKDMADKRLAYGFGTVVPLVILAIQLLTQKKYPALQQWLLRGLCLGILLTGLLCTLICTPDEMTILLLIFFFCIPMLFVIRPLDQIHLVLITDVIYFIAAPILKSTEVLSMDMLDMGIFSTLSLVLGMSHMQGRYRRYWLETEAVDLAEVRYQAAFIDQLTGVFNRNAFNRDSDRLEKGALPADFMYIALDLNGLKAANDTFGHVAGDELIIGAADCLRKSFSEYGSTYRVGGDEFVVLMNTKGVSEREILDNFNRTVDAWKGALVEKLSVSYGFVMKSEAAGMSLHGIGLLADKRMYQAKSDFYKNSGLDRRKN